MKTTKRRGKIIMQRSTINARWHSAVMDNNGCSSGFLGELKNELLASKSNNNKGFHSSYPSKTATFSKSGPVAPCKRKRPFEDSAYPCGYQ
eukprot:scaffold17595_cov113-Cylindrotheca_fusiformis.AAC.3